MEEKYIERQKFLGGAVDTIEAILGSELERTCAEIDNWKSTSSIQ